MKAVLCKEWGPAESLVVEDVPARDPGPGEVRVRVKAAGVNFPDVLIIQKKYQMQPALPFSPGSEAAGEVVAVGEGVTHVKPGDAVMAYAGIGCFAEEVVAPADKVMKIPAGVSYEVAAAFTLTYGTSWHAIRDRAALQPGETMLVLGAAGGVGLSAIEIGKAIGARVIAAASTDEKLAVCREHGADATINYEKEDLREAIKRETQGKGPDVIYDPVGGKFAEPAFRSIGWRGRYLVIGFAAGQIPSIPLNLALLKGASIVGVFWGDFTRREPQANLAGMKEMMGWLNEGKLRPHISGRYRLDEVTRALNDMSARKVTGKILIVP
ncbi:MAG: NADPH:quinone oxidoreductase family protein [Burkholderiaceae bacterium]|jgi:NADPH2:quinone reductase|nr:NADPH:quinone oxidoreductase family protein [Burkholderiales bacterium]MCZ8340286.1 NADPH:quinone oxidoreductase family protein [Burkholderiaceae bacterium]